MGLQRVRHDWAAELNWLKKKNKHLNKFETELLLSAVEKDGHQRGDEHLSPQTLGPEGPAQAGPSALCSPSQWRYVTAGQGRWHPQDREPGRGEVHKRTEGPLESSRWRWDPPPTQDGREGPQSYMLGLGLHTLAWVENVLIHGERAESRGMLEADWAPESVLL